ncbi:MAG: hypothetical protein SWY16_22325 [Cyanobacteriota bacterium]|nr:hypothetical protein [Cyanobacteriota bacterium]
MNGGKTPRSGKSSSISDQLHRIVSVGLSGRPLRPVMVKELPAKDEQPEVTRSPGSVVSSLNFNNPVLVSTAGLLTAGSLRG